MSFMGASAAQAAAAARAPPAGEDGIWSGILRATSASKSLPCKKVLVLGDAQSGKSTLIQRFGALGYAGDAQDRTGPSTDLALSYSYADLKDEENEDILARLGVFQLASPHKAYRQLLALDRQKLSDLMAVVVLDWTKPWLWLDQLHEWFETLETIVSNVVEDEDNLDKQRAALRQQQRVQQRRANGQSLRRDPPGSRMSTATSTIPEDPSDVDDDGADADDAGSSVHDSMTWYDRLCAANQKHFQDYLEPLAHTAETASVASTMNPAVLPVAANQQIVLPLAHGVLDRNLGIPTAIVCTKADHINTLERELGMDDDKFDFIQQVLRTVALHYGASVFYTSVSKPPTFDVLRAYIQYRLFPPQHKTTGVARFFTHRANVIDRDTVFVPAGWDTRGKIKLQREGSSGAEFEFALFDEFPGVPGDLTALYSALVPPPSGLSAATTTAAAAAALSPSVLEPAITATEEQSFLERQLAALRAAPSALSDDKVARIAQQSTAPTGSSGGVPKLGSPAGVAGAGGAPGGGNPSDQNAVLANFFQSLINNRSPTPGGGATPVSSASSAALPLVQPSPSMPGGAASASAAVAAKLSAAAAAGRATTPGGSGGEAAAER
ncbi:hypothetical protein H9P43_001812 [Blastocladiella emersonii ATCC 22665]|nr:hypothetical protein H9P43_001812 [Blastocladiella emersonii ATCC 22665]